MLLPAQFSKSDRAKTDLLFAGGLRLPFYANSKGGCFDAFARSARRSSERLLLSSSRARAAGFAASFLMRRVGLIFLVLGLAGFLLATHAATERGRGWDDARWALLGVAVMGVVFVILPGKSEGA